MIGRLRKPSLLVQIKPRFLKSPALMPTSAQPTYVCHSERSEAQSKNLSFSSERRLYMKARDASTSLSMTELHLSPQISVTQSEAI
jgi:hypothetical protein